MTTDFNLTSGRNRALVCYCTPYQAETIDDVIKGVFLENNVGYDTSSGCFSRRFSEPKTALNIALKWGETSRRLRVGGSFVDVCIGVFFYDQPTPPEPEPEPDEEPDDAEKWREYMSAYQSINQDEEPEPAPSLTSLVCDALRDTFGGVYGASAFVIPNNVTSFALEVE